MKLFLFVLREQGFLQGLLRFQVSLVLVLSRFNRVQLLENLWTVACQAPLSMGFSRQEH